MQLTNILRDVGEDLAVGRVYLPLDRMRYHGVDRELLEAMARHEAPIFPGYRNLLDELMEEADREYDRAFPGIHHLPLHFRAPVAIAARAYQGIHREIRRNQYDNLNRRARTGLVQKVALGGGALLRLLRPGRPGLALRRPVPGNVEGERTTAGPLRETGGEAAA
jgi:phytoene synthase